MKMRRNQGDGDFFDQDDQAPEEADTVGGSSSGGSAPTGLTGVTYGEPTTFGSQPWHTERNWWKIPLSGEANDVRSTFGTVGRLACAATSLRGNKHRLQAGVNQDSYSIVEVTTNDKETFLVAAVCDGMGSAAHSGYASRKAAAACTSVLSRALKIIGREMFDIPEERQARLVQEIRKSVVTYDRGEFDAPPVAMESVATSDLQTTLSFAIVAAGGPEKFDLMTGTIGDSPVILIRNGIWEWTQSDASGSGLHSTASDGLITTDVLDLNVTSLSAGDGLLICTDGVGNYLRFNGAETPLGRDLRERWTTPPDRLQFIRDLSFEIQSADDDRTAVVIWAR